MPERITSEQWGEAEKKVDEAELARREAAKAAGELGEASLEPEEQEILADTKAERGADAESLLGLEGSAERELVSLRWQNLTKAFRERRKIELDRSELVEKETRLLSRIKGEPTGAQTKALEKIRDGLEIMDEKDAELMESSPEAYFGLHLSELKEMKRELGEGRIVETPYVRKQAEDVATHLRAGKPVMLYGHLGTGKTELAMHVARNYLGKEALVVSGSKHTSLAELYGHQVLAIDRLKKEDVDVYTREVEAKFEEWVAGNVGSSEEDRNRAHERILQVYLAQKKGGTVSDFFLGPIYRAMQEGRPVIIDEVNAIPHEVLISLNHLLTRKVGDVVDVQQDSGAKVTIAEGFCVIMTGNLNQGDERYVDRQDLDPAFLSRLYKLEHDYLPQETEGALADTAGRKNELFQVLLARVMDKNGNVEAPQGTIAKLWRLAQAARVSQDVFAGRQVKDAFYFKQGGDRGTRYTLKESVLSMRAMDAIVSQWQGEGYKYELDHYVYKEFVAQSTNPADRAYLYQMLKDQFGFFTGPGWDQAPDYGAGGAVRAFSVPAPENRPLGSAFSGPRELVTAAFGAAPERAAWPEPGEEDADAGELSPDVLALEEWRAALVGELAGLDREVVAMCG